MARTAVSKVARVVLWSIFFLVSLLTSGLSLAPESDFHLGGKFQAAVLFSGIFIVAAAEFHIQRYELSSASTSLRLFLALLALPFTYYVAAVFAAHSELLAAWLILGAWLLLVVGLPTVLARFSRLDQHLLGGLVVFLSVGCFLLLVLALWLWPAFYYGYLMPGGHLGATPYLMGILGLAFWLMLLAVNRSIRNAVQQRVPADGLASLGRG